ncbi:FG-GAP-like repeat-containing protein [Thermodesulfobacteriota bacterium]
MLSKKTLFFVTNLFIFIFSIFCNPAPAAEPYRVLILPLYIHSEKDLSFLQNGIQDMLSTRLAQEGKIVPLSKEKARNAVKDIPGPINEQTAVSLGEGLGADYVLYGSLTVFGSSISTDARFADVHQKKPVVTFSQFGENQGDVISHVNLFARQINEKVFGRKTEAGPSPEQPQPARDVRSHPDSLWTGDQRSGADLSGEPATNKTRPFSFWKSRNFKKNIIGIAVGDVDGDGRNETVFISKNILLIYRYNNEKFEKVGEISGNNVDTFIRVDTADINNNGKSEIFVTTLIRKRARLTSFVLEWDGKNFKKILKKSDWYYRVLYSSGRDGNILLGQQRQGDDAFKRNGVYELIWSDGQYEPVQRQILPKHVNIFDFTYGDVLNNGKEMIVAFSPSSHLRIFDQNGNKEWESPESYGGSSTYIESPSDDIDVNRGVVPDRMDRYFIPQRIHIADLDNDGKKEVIVAKNVDLTGKLLPRVKIFSSGHIESIDMDQLGFALKWKSREISGHISDCVIADLDNDGEKELVFSAVAKTDLLSTKQKSYIVSMKVSKQ